MGNNLQQGIRMLDACARVSIAWAESRVQEIDTANTEAALFKPGYGNMKRLRLKIIVNIRIWNRFIRFKKNMNR